MKPHENYADRPKKTGARKRQRILAQKRRLIAAGYDEKQLDKITVNKLRDLLKQAARRKRTATGQNALKKSAAAKKTRKPRIKKPTLEE